MGAFFLCLNKNKPLEQARLSFIANELIHFSWVNTSSYSENGLQLVYTVNKDDSIKIFKDRNNSLTFFLQGYICESSQGIEKIDEVAEGNSLENQLVNRYLKSGICSCVGLNGLYNLMVWNQKTNILEIAGDRLGIFQIFFVTLNNGGVVITTDISLLRLIDGYTSKISKRGIFDLLYMGVAFENRTVLQGVERLLPNSCYRIDNRKLCLLAELKLPFSKERWGRTVPSVLEELQEYYMRAVTRQISRKNKIIFLQSGGKDCRVFSYFLKKANIIPECLTVGEKHHGEVFIAKNVCKKIGFPWIRFALSQSFNYKYAMDLVTIDSFSSRFFSPYLLEVVNTISKKYDYAVSAFVGDPVFGSTIKKGKLKDRDSFENAFYNYLAYWRNGLVTNRELNQLFPGEAENFIYEYNHEALNLFEKLAEEPYQSLIAYGLRTNERFKIGSMLRSLNAALPIRLPVVDNDLMDFAFSLSPAMLYERFILDRFLVENAKIIAQIPIDQNSYTYSSLTRGIKFEVKFKLWELYTRKMKLPCLELINPVAATTQFYFQIFSMRDKGFKKLKKYAADRLYALEGILDIDTARNILERQIPGNKNHIMSGNSIRALIASILAADTLLDKKPCF